MFETDDPRLRLRENRRLFRGKLDLLKQLYQVSVCSCRALSTLLLFDFLLFLLRASHVLWKGVNLALVCGR